MRRHPVRGDRRWRIAALAGARTSFPQALLAEEAQSPPAAPAHPLEPLLKELDGAIRQLQEFVRQM